MYKVFNKSQTIIITNKKGASTLDIAIKHYVNPIKDHVIKLIKDLLQSDSQDAVLIAEEPEHLVQVFEAYFDIHNAAGGWVFNNDGALLMIKRNGVWDIPKGHVELGESLEETAIREVEEETGVKDLKIMKPLGTSRHIYFIKNKAVLKCTHWFKMRSDFKEILLPQQEEGIVEVGWIKGENIEGMLREGWLSLWDFYSLHREAIMK